MLGDTSQLFAHHPRSWRENRYVYAVISRRSKGLSIGVDLNPDKVCNFDCVYCCVDRRTPPSFRKVDLGVLKAELQHMLQLAATGEIYRGEPFDQTPTDMRRLNDVAFSGSGEPTAYAKFGDACRIAADLLAMHKLQDVKIVLITNATLLHRPGVAKAMEFLDQHNGEIWAKLDAGTEEYYRLLERTKVPLSRVMKNLAEAGRVRPIVIQSLFMSIRGTPPADAEIDAYVARLSELRDKRCQIKLVQVYTTARRTAEGYVTALDERILQAIGKRIRAFGLPADVYP